MQKINFLFIALLTALFLNINLSGFSYAKVISGNINKEDFLEKAHTVVDGATGNPVSGADVSVPAERIFTKTNGYGQFKLDASVKSPAILSVNADGYKPFSLTINEGDTKSPLTIVATKLFGNETVIDKKIRHLGDNKFSPKSANSDDFNLKAEGPYFFKEFFLGNIDSKVEPVLKIGSVIGLDTEIAKKAGQSKVTISSSTPTKIFLNSQKVGEIKLNGDNLEISLPPNILKPNAYNTIRIETGVNEDSLSYIDYDDMEFMNIILNVK